MRQWQRAGDVRFRKSRRCESFSSEATLKRSFAKLLAESEKALIATSVKQTNLWNSNFYSFSIELMSISFEMPWHKRATGREVDCAERLKRGTSFS